MEGEGGGEEGLEGGSTHLNLDFMFKTGCAAEYGYVEYGLQTDPSVLNRLFNVLNEGFF